MSLYTISWTASQRVSSITGGISSLDKKVDDVTQKVEGVANDVQAVGDIPLLKNGVVKSVQRGVTSLSLKNTGSEKKEIAISTVNVDRAILLANITGSHDDYRDASIEATILLSANNISLKNYRLYGRTTTFCLSWQVIEFY